MTKRQRLLEIVQRSPRHTAQQYAGLAGRPRPSVRRDLAQLAKLNIVRRCRSWDDPLKWDGRWEAI